MSSFVVKNNAESLVADNPLAQAAVMLNVTSSEGANFPSTFPFLITIWDESVYPDPSDDSGMEIVKCTARTTDALTIVRGQEGTGDVAHALGERVAMLITAGIIDELIAEIVDDTSPQLGGDLDPNTHFIGMAKGGDIASASPLVVDTDGDYFDVTGTTGFAAMTVAANRHFFLQFDGILTMTHHATNLDLPGEANITTAAGDVGEFFSTGANTVQCVAYTKADGTAVSGGGATLITKSIADIATDINGFSLAAVPAGMMNGWGVLLSASIFNEAGFTVANKALVFNEAGFTVANKALVFNEAGFTVANKAGVCNHTNLTAAVLNSICDNVNISTAMIKAILDIETVTVASQLGAMLEGTQLTAANAATVCNEKYTAAQKAAAFDNAIMSAARSALICNEAGFTVANKALVFNEAGFTVANKALVFNEAGFTVANKASVLENNNLSIANIDSIVGHANMGDAAASAMVYATAVATRDLSSAANIIGTAAIIDGWTDDKLTARDSNATTPIQISAPYPQDATAFRPEWTVSANVSAAGGKLVFSTASAIKTAEIASTFVTGTWEVDAVRGTSYNGWLGCKIIDDGTDYYAWYADGNSTTYHLDRNATHLITGTWTNDAATHTFKTTRDGSGNFEIFEDGISKGTVTNTDTTTSVKQIITNASSTGGSTDTYDNYKVY